MAINPTPFTPKTSKKKTNPLFVMLGIAMVLGLSAAFGIWQYLNKSTEQTKQQQAKLNEVQKIKVVVSTKEIMQGLAITSDDIVLKDLPAQTVPQGCSGDLNSRIGRVAQQNFAPDEPITEAKLIPQGAAGGLPSVIPPGYRAITIKVNDVIGVGGFIKPGDHVDILSIRRGIVDSSDIILQNVLIIAVGDLVYDPANTPDLMAMIVPQVTVALDTINSEKLALASSSSQIQLLLRPHGETQLADAKGITLEDIYPDLQEEEADEEEVLTTVIEPKDSIDIILGNKRTTYHYY